MFTRNRTKKILAALTQLKELNTQRAGLVTELGAHVERLAEQVEGIVDGFGEVLDRDTIEDIVTEKIESAVDTDDITEEITSSYTFTSAVESAVDDQLNGMSMEDMGVDIDTLVADALSEAVEDGSLLTLIASKLAVTVAPEPSEIQILDNPTEEVPA
jgi:hypothetical protein